MQFPFTRFAAAASLLFVFFVLAGFAPLFTSTASNDRDTFVRNSLGQSDLVRVVQIQSNDIIFNPSNNRIYFSTPSTATGGNSLQYLDPNTLELSAPAWIGSEPGKLAISADGQTIYAVLDGAYAVRRFDVVANSPGQHYFLGADSTTRYKARDLAVSPDDANVFAVSRFKPGVSPPGGGVAIFRNGTQLPNVTPGHSDSSDYLAFSDSESLLYGTGQYSGLKTINVSINGATVATSSSIAAGGQIKYQNGRIVSSLGHVIDTSTRTLLGTFPNANSSAFALDVEHGRAYYVVRDEPSSSVWHIRAYSLATFTQIGSLTVGNFTGVPTSLVRWGSNGLAFRTSGGQLFVVQTGLVPTGEPIPTPSPTPSITPTPTPTPVPAAISAVYIGSGASGIEYNPNDQKLYVSLPSSAGPIGNSIASIDPTDGSIGGPIFIGSEPSKIVISSDRQKLFVGLDGARSIREFNLGSQTPGLQYTVGSTSSDGPLRIIDIAAAPDDPAQIAVSRSSAVSFPGAAGTAIIDNGVLRPETRGGGSSIVYGSTNSQIFGTSSSGRLDIMTVTANGITSVETANFDSSIRIKHNNGKVYGSRGGVMDPVSRNFVGTFALGVAASNSPFILIVPEHDRILFLNTSPKQVLAFELSTFRKLETLELPGGGTPTGFVRFGSNGVAVSQSGGPVLLIRSPIVDPTIPVVPSTPGPTPTPTPSPSPAPRFQRIVNRAVNDMIVNPVDGLIYTSVPGAVTDGTGNTITSIDPATGNVIASGFVGSEPGRIAMSDNGQVLWTTLAGSDVIRRYDIPTRTPGPQFSPDGGVSRVRDMAVQPGSPETLVVATQSDGTWMYDDGVRRPNPARRPPPNSQVFALIGSLEFAGGPGTLFGYNSLSTGYELYRINIDANGLSTETSVGNLISGFNGDIKFLEGRLYTASGRVVDPLANTIVGTFASSGSSIAVDTVTRKAFILSSGSIRVFNIDTFRELGTINFPNTSSSYSSLARWGSNGLAFRAFGSSESRIILIQSPLVGEGELPVGLAFPTTLFSTFEGSAGVQITVVRSGEVNSEASVNYATSDGTAVAGEDYIAVSGTISFAPGETVKGFTVPIINDTVFENGNETFSIMLSEPSGTGAQLIFPSTTTVSITDNDPQPRLSPDDNLVNEPSGGTNTTVNVKVRLSNPSVQTVSVNFTTVANTAQPGSDYIATNGTLNFSPLETIKEIPITVIGDNTPEGDETFYLDLSSAINGNIIDSRAVITIADYLPTNITPFDFDGDGKTDISIFRSAVGQWWLNQSEGGVVAYTFGNSDDVLAPADFTGDGKTDIAFWRPSSGEWFILRSEDSTFYSFPFGVAGDIVVPADYDGDTLADPAVFRPESGTWYVQQSTGGTIIRGFGISGDRPIPADYDGDGKADLAVYRPEVGQWWLDRTTAGVIAYEFGNSTDIVVPGDYTGDGKADAAFYRDGLWYILRSDDASFYSFPFGSTNDLPTPGDYDGDGSYDAAVYRPAEANWYILRSTAGILVQQFGAVGDTPVPSAYVR